MKVRNNTNQDYPLTFSDGHCLMLSRAEISRDITEKEQADPYFKKELKQRRILDYREPPRRIKKVSVPNKETPKKPETEVEEGKEEKPETTRVIKKKVGKKKSKFADKD